MTRALAAFDGGKPVALAGAYPFELTIPGGQLPCAGVTLVGVLPTHRRRGMLRLDAPPARGHARLGRADRGAVGVGGGDLRPLRLRAGGAEHAHEVGHRAVRAADRWRRLRPARRRRRGVRALPPRLRARARRPPRNVHARRAVVEGAPSRGPGELAAGASKKFYAAVELDGEVEGYALYRVKDEWRDGFASGEVRVIEALATSPAAAGALWRFLHDIDLTMRVEVSTSTPVRALPLLVRDPRALGLRLGDGSGSASSTRRSAEGALVRPAEPVVLQVRDELCPGTPVATASAKTPAAPTTARPRARRRRPCLAPISAAYDFHRLCQAGLVEERSRALSSGDACSFAPI